MSQDLTLRAARQSDIGALDRLFQRSYSRLLAADYPPSVLVTAVPMIARAQPDLVASGQFHVVEGEGGGLLGAGGWSRRAPGGGPARDGLGHIRHVATDPDATRRGVGRRLLTHILDEAKAAGIGLMHCQSTRTAQRFYAAMGFEAQGEIILPLRGLDFPAVFMSRNL